MHSLSRCALFPAVLVCGLCLQASEAPRFRLGNSAAPERYQAELTLSPAEDVIHDYHAQGLSLRGHPLAPLRPFLDKERVVPASALESMKPNRRYRVAGLVLLRQRPGTAKGITFMTLEYETGIVNLIVRLQVWQRYRRHTWTVVMAIGSVSWYVTVAVR